MPESKKTGKTLPKGMGKTPAKAVAKKPAAKKPSTSYSPTAYVTGFRKERIAVEGAASKSRSDARIAAKKAASRGPKAGSSVVSKVGKVAGKVVGRAKTVAREVRDIPTAAANIYESRSLPKGDVRKFAKKDLKKQIKEVGSAIKSGKKGTQAASENYQGKKGTYVGAGTADYYISRPKKPRK